MQYIFCHLLHGVRGTNYPNLGRIPIRWSQGSDFLELILGCGIE